MDHTSHGINSFVYRVEDGERLQKRLLTRFPEFDIAVSGKEESTEIEVTVYHRFTDRKLASTHVYGEDFIGLPGGAFDGILQTVEVLVASSDLTVE